MDCPCCGHENITGMECCSDCGSDLTEPQAASMLSLMEASILEAPLSRLEPSTPVIVDPETSLAQVVDRLCEEEIGCVLVGRPGHVQGVFSERDLLLRIAHRWEEVQDRPVSEFMTPDPESLQNDTPIAFAMNCMSVGDFRHVPIATDGRTNGIVSMRDVLDFVCDWYPELAGV